ncbi:MAG: HAD hydrolase family protein [Candidatus Curtissbacteria bacterium]|nr:HAD hydrolase family protein [Candidatus Curtissbacteria bacterium]
MSKRQLVGVRAREVKLVVFDFDGVFTDNTVWVFEDGSEAVRCNRCDGIGLSKLRKAGILSWVISKEKNPVVRLRCRKLKIPCLTGVDEKRLALEQLLKRLNIEHKNTAYVGNDINDLECMTAVGLPISVSDAYEEVKAVSLYITQKAGGLGAVREICDLIVTSKNGSS